MFEEDEIKASQRFTVSESRADGVCVSAPCDIAKGSVYRIVCLSAHLVLKEK